LLLLWSAPLGDLVVTPSSDSHAPLPVTVAELREHWRELPPTLPLWPETGQLLGLSRAATFRAAARGDFEVVTLGRRKLALTVPLLKLLGLDLVERP
jgi:hypothetical protein